MNQEKDCTHQPNIQREYQHVNGSIIINKGLPQQEDKSVLEYYGFKFHVQENKCMQWKNCPLHEEDKELVYNRVAEGGGKLSDSS